jgi:hypothetical protein
MNKNGNQVPITLSNISRLCSITSATTKKSSAITIAVKMIAVTNGEVYPHFVKYTLEIARKINGAAMKCIIKDK